MVNPKWCASTFLVMVAAVGLASGCGSVGDHKDGGGSGGSGGSGGGGGSSGSGGSGGSAAGGSGGARDGGADTTTDAPASDAPAPDGGSDARADGASSDAAPADGAPSDVAVNRCSQPVSAGDCTGQIPRSCQELYGWGARTDGAYKIDPDGSGVNPALVTMCEMNTRDQIGWTLMAKVQTANTDSVEEQRTWFITEANTSMLGTLAFINNQPPAAHGAYKFAPLVSASSIARFDLVAQTDTTQKATWYKVVSSAAGLQTWFTANDTTASRVCTDLALTLNCATGTIAPSGGTGSATFLNGMNLTPFGYTASGAIHMRLNDDGSPNYSGVCSNTFDTDANKWKDTYGTHWGNGLLIWIN